MGVDVTKANTQAAQLQEYANQLRNAKKSLESYQTELSLNWVGTETQYIFTAISNQINKINSVVAELESLQGDVKSVATQIRNEEIAAEEAAKKAREEAERKAREEEARRQAEAAAKAEAERQAAAKAEAERQAAAKAEAERKAAAKAEAERKAAEEAKKKTQSTTSGNSNSKKNSSSSSSKKSSSSSSAKKPSVLDKFVSMFK